MVGPHPWKHRQSAPTHQAGTTMTTQTQTQTQTQAVALVDDPWPVADGRVTDEDLVLALHAAVEASQRFESQSIADRTRDGYTYSWRAFAAWCSAYGVSPLPARPDVLGAYIGHLAITGGSNDEHGNPTGRKASTIVQHVSGISAVHRDRGEPDPTKSPYVQRVMRGLKRTKGLRRTQREPMTLRRLFRVVGTIDDRRLITARDRVIIAADALLDPGPITAAQLAQLDWSQVLFGPSSVTLEPRSRGPRNTMFPITISERGGPLCLVGALRELAEVIVERLRLEADLLTRTDRGPGVMWLTTYGDVVDFDRPEHGPVMVRFDRRGTLQEGWCSRATIATRLSRAAEAVGVKCSRQARPVWTDEQREAAVKALSMPRLSDTRDRALLLLGFALAARRSNLSLLAVGEVAVRPEGLLVHFRRSKTDQEGVGRDIAVPRKGGPFCPVAAWDAWLAALSAELGSAPDPSYPAFPALDRSGTRVAGPRPVYMRNAAGVVHNSDGEPVFSHWEGICGDEINLIVQRRARNAGLATDPDTGVALNWGGHSLRRGWMTEAARQGISLEQMMDHSGHVTVDVALEYIAEAKKFDPQHSAAMKLQFDLEVPDEAPTSKGIGALLRF